MCLVSGLVNQTEESLSCTWLESCSRATSSRCETLVRSSFQLSGDLMIWSDRYVSSSETRYSRLTFSTWTHTREHTCLHHWSHSRILEMIIDSCVITGAHACSAILKPHSSPVRVHCCNADLDRENTVSQSWEKLNRKIKQWLKLLSYLSTPLHTWVSETHTNRGKHQHRHTTAHSHMIRKW